MTLTEFLTARINEDERRLDAPDFTETDSVRGSGWGDRGDCPICGAYAAEGTESVTAEAWYQHADWVHQRARVLAECEAKRRIVHEHASIDAGQWGAACGRCADWISPKASYPEANTTAGFPCATLRLLALPYADHPDYDEAAGLQ